MSRTTLLPQPPSAPQTVQPRAASPADSATDASTDELARSEGHRDRPSSVSLKVQRTPARAFVAIKAQDRSWVVDLPAGQTMTLGHAPASDIVLTEAGCAAKHASMLWDGQRLSMRVVDEQAISFLNGKRCLGQNELRPGDELVLGGVQLVVGVAVAPSSATGRRALTHHEFRERLYEELARAARGGRSTVLVMVRARPGDGHLIAQTALDAFRAGDVVGTYAHDEFEFLLPDTSEAQATQVVERILSWSNAENARAGIAVAPDHGDSAERLIQAARRALQVAYETTGTRDTVMTPPPRGQWDVTPECHDPATRRILDEVRRLSATRSPVLFVGEANTGKLLFARQLHRYSELADGPMVVIPCARLVDDATVEAAFGDEGRALRAARGTLVLDDVGELTVDAQRRCLHALERLGHTTRLVGTTQLALSALVERGCFERALYERLASTVIDVPPLRNRPHDIVPLASRFAREAGLRGSVRFSPGALARLRSHAFTGNVLELRNAMERAVRLCGGGEILAEHLPSETLPVASSDGKLREHVDSVERDAIVKALADTNFNQTHTAKRLGISRRALIYKMEKYGLKRPPGHARR